MEAVRVEMARGSAVSDQVQGDAAGLGTGLRGLNAVADNLAQVGVTRANGYGIGGDRQEVADQVQEPLGVSFRDSHVHLDVGVEGLLIQSQVHIAED